MSIIREMAEIVAGLQVPMSIQAPSLALAGPHYDALRNEAKMFGWQNVDEIELALKRAIANEIVEALGAQRENAERA